MKDLEVTRKYLREVSDNLLQVALILIEEDNRGWAEEILDAKHLIERAMMKIKWVWQQGGYRDG